MALLFCVPLALVMYFIRFGFDITDEALYVMGFTHPSEIRIYCTFFQRIGASLLLIGSPGIVEFRILRLVLSLFSAGVFSFGMLYFLQHHPDSKIRFPKWSFVWCMLTGVLHNFSLFPITLSYNSMAPVFMLVGFGTFLPALLPEMQGWKKNGLVFCTSLSVMALLFVKVTSGIALLLILIFLTLYFIPDGAISKSRVMALVELIPASLFGALTFVFLLFGNIDSMKQGLIEYFVCLSTAQGYDLNTLSAVYTDDVLGVTAFLLSKWYVFVPVLLAFVSWGKPEKNVRLFGIFFLIYFGILSVDIVIHKSFQAGHGFTREIYKPFALLILGLGGFLMAALRRNMIEERNNKALWLCLVFLLVPFAGASGSNIFISVQAMNYSVFLFPFLFVASQWISSTQQHSIGTLIIPLFVWGLVTAQIFSGMVMHPYRQPTNLRTATVNMNGMSGNHAIMMHPSMAQTIDSLKLLMSIKNVKVENEFVFSGFSEMGLVYSLGAITPGVAPLNLKNPRATVNVLSRCSRAKLKNMIFLVDTSECTPALSKELHRVGLNFPESYIPMGSVSYYSYRDFKTKTLFVYTPEIIETSMDTVK